MGNVYNSKNNKCPICGQLHCEIWADNILDCFYRCESCGDFFIPSRWEYSEKKMYNTQHLKSYLYYNNGELRPYITTAEKYDKMKKEDWIDIYNLTPEMVEQWYPKTIEEKINRILLKLYDLSEYDGDDVFASFEDLKKLCFVKNIGDIIDNDSNCKAQIDYILKAIKEMNFISFDDNQLNNLLFGSKVLEIQLTITGLSRVYELQKTNVENKNVFVAMKFGVDTADLREAIKKGLKGYNVRIMDEIEHNHQIVPEMLYEIRNSRFVIAELSHHNNGAYYEAGYALGLGKEVIHICSKEELKSGLHFDVAQINTIIYDTIDELPERIKKRIDATIK